MGDVKVYDGEQVEVGWDKRLCIHVGECGRAANDVFTGGRDPWCDPDTDDASTVVDVVTRCPTGALSFRRKDGGPSEQAPAENTIVVANNGPLYVRGDLEVDGAADDMPGVRRRVALCRCGLSANKPFCDNTHEGAFQDHGAVGQSGAPLDETGGTLAVNRAKNGPLLLKGNVTIVASSGRRAWQGTKAALCRCGHSGNKPFCDGSHAKQGFVAD